MSGEERRQEIIKILKSSNKAISGGKLADKLDVSRQLIVGDVALIRASGVDILSTPKGYILNEDNKNNDYIIKTIVCKHSKDNIEDELNTIVDEGATVMNVVVEHGVYGQLSGDLYVSSRRDVKEFIKKLNSNETNPLSDLTDGIHLHTIKYKDEETFERVKQCLKEKDYLY